MKKVIKKLIGALSAPKHHQNSVSPENVQPVIEEHVGGKVNVGCGPKPRDGWINIDIQPFPSVDVVMDVTKEWNFKSVDYVYAEHFIEHLALEDGVEFLVNAGKSLKNEGWIRLSTPNIEWVLKTHYDWANNGDEAKLLASVTATNRAFYGWGHRFLYSPWILQKILQECGYQNVRFETYGESQLSEFSGIEKHTLSTDIEGYPSLVIVEAQKLGEIKRPKELLKTLEESFLKYARAKG